MSSLRNQDMARLKPANGNNVEYMTSFIKTPQGNPSAWNDGMHTYHNAYIKTTSNMNGGLNEPYRMAMTSAHFDITDIEHSYWHFQVIQTIDFTQNQQLGMIASQTDNYVAGASDSRYEKNATTWETLSTAIKNNSATVAGVADTKMDIKGQQDIVVPVDAPLAVAYIKSEDNQTLNTEYLKNQYVFIGLKYSAEFVDDYHFIFNNADVNSSRQLYGLTEGFIYGSQHSKEEAYNKRNVFTQYEEVNKLKNSICGIYISLYDIITGAIYDKNYDLKGATNINNGAAVAIQNSTYTPTAGVVVVPIDIIIPFDGLLSTQAFQVYPNCIFGDLGMEFRFTFNGLVHCEVDPIYSIQHNLGGHMNSITQGLSDALFINNRSLYYTHAFEQVGNPSFYKFILGYNDNIDSKIFTTGIFPMAPVIGQSQIAQAWSDIRGWRITDEAKLQLTEIFRKEPFVIPSQFINYRNFEMGPDEQGLVNSTCSMPLVNTTDIYFLFPEHANDRTVFRNIQAEHFQISVNSIKYPWQLLNTLSPEFYQIQMNQSDFDNFFSAPDDYENSITTPRTVMGKTMTKANNVSASNTNTNLITTEKINLPPTDNTMFVPSVKLQRPSSGEPLWFDGITQRYSTIIINANPLTIAADNLNSNTTNFSAANNPYFSNTDKGYDPYGILHDGVGLDGGCIPFNTNKPVPICVPLRQTYMIFRLVNGGGRDYKNFQYLLDDEFTVGYMDPSKNAVSY